MMDRRSFVVRQRVREWLGLDEQRLSNIELLGWGADRHGKAIREQLDDVAAQLDRIEKALVVDIPQRKLEPKPRVQTFEDMEQEALKELEKEPT